MPCVTCRNWGSASGPAVKVTLRWWHAARGDRIIGRMWSSLPRPRRRGTAAAIEPVVASTTSDMAAPLDVAVGRPELDRLSRAILVLLGPGSERPTTPDTLGTSLTAALTRIGCDGTVSVERRPAGLYTPETWHIHVDRATDAAADAVRSAIRTGVFE